MRIFHIQLGRGGGTERFFVNLATAFHDAGAVQSFGLRAGVDHAAEIAGLGQIHEGPFLRRTPGGLFARLRLLRAVRGFRPDAMIGWRAPTAGLIPDLPGMAKLVRLGDYPTHTRHFRGLDAVVCNNPSIAAHIRELGWTGAAPVISNFARPVDLTPVSRDALGTPDDAFVICGAGRFARNKGFDTLIRAAAECPGAWLWLVGDGPERGALEALAKELGIAQRTRFAGWVAEPMAHIAAADAFVMPSRDEPLGNALIEAFHAGTPAVTTRTDGPRWYAQDGRDCLMVETEDVQAMAAALARLRADPALGETLVKGARGTLSARFSRDAVVAAYFELIDGIRRSTPG